MLFDAFGTLIELDRPAARLQAAARTRLGSEISHEQAAEAMRVELTHYAAHCSAARDHPTLLHLQRECAAIVLDRLGLEAGEATALEVLSDAIAFRAFPDAPPALRMVRDLGLATAVVSNGDCSLPGALRAAGIEVGVVVDSATGGAAKPDPTAPPARWPRRPLVPAGRARSPRTPAAGEAGWDGRARHCSEPHSG